MVSKSILVSKLSPYLSKKKIIVYDQKTNDIIEELIKNHKINSSEYDKISKYFYNDNVLVIAKNLFDFCKKNIDYVIEKGTDQTLRSPAAILINGSGDCKQYSQFICGILDSINRNYKKIDCCYRFAAYNDNKEIQHVFVVVKHNNKEYWIDPVLNYFNEKKQYNFKKDKKMSLYQISGVKKMHCSGDEIGFSLRLKDISLKNLKRLVVNVATFPARQAFLAIVSVNAFDLAKKIAKGILKDRQKMFHFWTNIGGDFNALLRAVNNKQSEFKVSGFKIGDPATGTVAVVASPIVVACLAVLKEIGIDDKNIGKSIKNIVIDKTAEVIKNNGKALIENGVKQVVKIVNGNPVLVVTKADPTEITNEVPNEVTPMGTKKDNTLLYVGGAALALYLFNKKK